MRGRKSSMKTHHDKVEMDDSIQPQVSVFHKIAQYELNQDQANDKRGRSRTRRARSERPKSNPGNAAEIIEACKERSKSPAYEELEVLTQRPTVFSFVDSFEGAEGGKQLKPYGEDQGLSKTHSTTKYKMRSQRRQTAPDGVAFEKLKTVPQLKVLLLPVHLSVTSSHLSK